MTFPRFTFVHKDQRGFTLVELLVAIALVGIITVGITMTISQILTINVGASNHMIAVRQVQQAYRAVRNDALQAQSVNVTEEADSGFPLTLAWEDWDGGDNVVEYTLQDMPSSAGLKMLERSHSINGTAQTTAPAIVAQYIDDSIDSEPPEAKTKCTWDGTAMVLTFKVTATVGSGPQGASETRTYEIEPRPDQTT